MDVVTLGAALKGAKVYTDATIAPLENNISKQQDTTAQGGNGYAIINGGRVYFSDTAPTGTIPTGSIWIGG